MKFEAEYLPEALDDLKKLDKSVQVEVLKGIEKIKSNPYPCVPGLYKAVGYGKPLGNKSDINLGGLMKVKLRKRGIRIVYKLYEIDNRILVIVIGVRSDNQVYIDALSRRKKHNL